VFGRVATRKRRQKECLGNWNTDDAAAASNVQQGMSGKRALHEAVKDVSISERDQTAGLFLALLLLYNMPPTVWLTGP
jgi:hypothetical protein